MTQDLNRQTLSGCPGRPAPVEDSLPGLQEHRISGEAVLTAQPRPSSVGVVHPGIELQAEHNEEELDLCLFSTSVPLDAGGHAFPFQAGQIWHPHMRKAWVVPYSNDPELGSMVVVAGTPGEDTHTDLLTSYVNE